MSPTTVQEAPIAYKTPAAHAARRGLHHQLGLAVLFIVIVSLHLYSLTRTPPVFVDEAFTASLAWGLVHDGIPYGPLQGEVFKQYPGYWALFSWSSTWLYSLPIRLVGLDLFALRLVSLVFGVILLLAVYTIGSRLYGRRASVLAVLLVALFPAFFYSGHMARPDSMVIAAGYGAIALYLTDRGRGLSPKSVLAGLLIGLAFEMHPPTGILFGPVLLMLFVIDYGRSVLKHPRFWGFAGAASAMLALFLSVHVLPYPATYQATATIAFGDTKTPPLLAPSLWLPSLVDTGSVFARVEDLRLPLLLGATVMLASRRSPADLRALAIVGMLTLQFITMIPYKPAYYASVIAPATALLVAALLDRLLHLPLAGSVFATARTVLVATLLLTSFVSSMTRLAGTAGQDFEAVVGKLSTVIAPDSRLMGGPIYWLAYPNHPYISWTELTYYRQRYPGTSLEDAIRAYRPDVFIIDQIIELHITDDPIDRQPVDRILYLPKSELEDFLNRHGRLAVTVTTSTGDYRRVRAFAIGQD